MNEPNELEMGRVSVMLPVETIRQIDAWAALAGLKRGQFLSVALVMGSRILARQMSPESFMNSDAWRGMAEAMGLSPEQAQELVTKSQAKN